MDATLLQNVALIAGAVIVVGLGLAVVNFARREAKGSARSEEDLLARFQAAYDAGEMDTGEFRRVTESLRRRSGGEASALATPPGGAAPPPRDRPDAKPGSPTTAGDKVESPSETQASSE